MKERPCQCRSSYRYIFAMVLCTYLILILRMELEPDYNIFLLNFWRWKLHTTNLDSCTFISTKNLLRHTPHSNQDPTQQKPPINDNSIIISVITGSETRFRTTYQQATWANPHDTDNPFNFQNVSFFDENDVAQMKLGMNCQESAAICGRDNPPESHLINRKKKLSWWCFQNRELLVLYHQLIKYPDAQWFFVVNDDTYVNVPALRTKIQAYSATRSACALGDVGHLQFPFLGTHFWTPIIWDGAGVLINRNAANKLLRVVKVDSSRDSGIHNIDRKIPLIEQCILNTRIRNKWCWWHSDWVLSRCLDSAGIGVTSDHSFVQFPRSMIAKTRNISGSIDFNDQSSMKVTEDEKDRIASYCMKKTACHNRKTLKSMMDIHNKLIEEWKVESRFNNY